MAPGAPAGRVESETKGSSQGGPVDVSSAPAGRAESETRGSSQGGAVDASSAPAGRAESETVSSSQEGAVDASSTPAWRAERETKGSFQGGTVDASSVPIGRAESDRVDPRSNLPRHRQRSLFLRRGADIGSVPSSVPAAAQLLREIDPNMRVPCHICSTPSLGHYLRWLWRCCHCHRQPWPSHHRFRWSLYRLAITRHNACEYLSNPLLHETVIAGTIQTNTVPGSSQH